MLNKLNLIGKVMFNLKEGTHKKLKIRNILTGIKGQFFLSHKFSLESLKIKIYLKI